LHVSDYLLNDEPCNNDFIDRVNGSSSHGHEGDNRIPTQNSIGRAHFPVIFIVNTTSESLLKFSMSYFLLLQYHMYKCIHASYIRHAASCMHRTCLIHASYIRHAASCMHCTCLIHTSYIRHTASCMHCTCLIHASYIRHASSCMHRTCLILASYIRHAASCMHRTCIIRASCTYIVRASYMHHVTSSAHGLNLGPKFVGWPSERVSTAALAQQSEGWCV
jgi:hypothetical protein